MKMLNAFTYELDEPEVAVAEVLSQLDLDNNTQKNAIAFITCSYDFVESGMVEAICEALPFDVVGCTTLTNANNDETDSMLLCLSVLTADDCTFSAALTEPLRGDCHAEVKQAVEQATAGLEGSAKMALAFLPMGAIAGETILAALEGALEGVPILGTIGCDFDTVAFSNTFIFHNGACVKDCLAFLLIAGNVNPRFVVASTSEQNLRKQQALITSSDGNILKQINNMSASDYFASIGITAGRGVEGMVSIPFVVDYGDGTQPVARAIYGFNEDGSAICGGVMPEGGTLYIGRMDMEDILETAAASTQELLDIEDLNGIIAFPCLGRNMVLATEPYAEIEKVNALVGDRVPIHLAYSGGECCPVYARDGSTVNRFHNFTFTACAI